jgi:tetratricopeptide (TPR) repeat protein
MSGRILLVALAGVAGAASLQGAVGAENAARRANDFRYTPDPKVMRVLAGGDRSACADMLWLSALPDMARPFEDRALKKRWIAAATDVITDLEPTFATVYGYGAAHLNLVDRNPDEAIALLSKGIAKNPDSAGLHVALAMVYYEYKKDKAKAVELLEKASVLPGIDSLSLAMLASLRVDERDDFTALAVWAKQLDGAPNANVRTICEYELWRTKALIAARASREFAAAHGRPPADAAELRDPKLISASALDVVLEGLTVDAKGRPHYEHLDELDRRQIVLKAESYVAGLASYLGRLPTADEFFLKFGQLPDPGPGRRWEYADGRLSLVAK